MIYSIFGRMDFLQATYTHKSVNGLLCKNCTYITGNISLGGENKNIPNLVRYNFVFIQKHIKNPPSAN